MRENRSMPSSTVIPVLSYPDVRSAVEWLCRVFGFAERRRIGDHRAQLTFGAGSVVVAGSADSGQPNGSGVSVMVRVADVDAHFARASAAGANVTQPPASLPYGERQYTATDPGGYTWTFSESVYDIAPSTWGGELIGGAS